MALELLRALWRVAGKQLESGAIVDLDALPPGMGGGSGALPVLEALQARQFVVVGRAGGGTRLTDARRPLSDAPIDWAVIDRRRRAELSKVDAMQRYAYHTGCRRHFVLRYFGDPAARNQCTGCDNCLGVKHEVIAPTLPTAVPKAGGGRSRPRSGAVAEPSATDLVLGPEEAALFNALKTVRGELARAEQVPAYVVFPDRTLAEFAVRRPRTLAAMGDVRGVGPTKLEKYGDRFLRALREAEGTEAA